MMFVVELLVILPNNSTTRITEKNFHICVKNYFGKSIISNFWKTLTFVNFKSFYLLSIYKGFRLLCERVFYIIDNFII